MSRHHLPRHSAARRPSPDEALTTRHDFSAANGFSDPAADQHAPPRRSHRRAAHALDHATERTVQISPVGRRAGRWRPATTLQQVLVLTGRSLRLAFGDRKLVFFGLLQPIVLLLLFSQVFSGIGALPGVAEYNGYINYLLPATLVTIALTTAVGAGVGLLTEVFTGFIGRLRAMPLTLGAVLVARTLADSTRLALSLTAAVVIAIPVLGFRPGSVVGLLLGMLLTVVVGWGLSWLFIAIACWQPKPEAMQAASFVVMVPLMFGSSAYLPVEAMPTWVRWFSSVNPVTYAVDAVRALSLDRPAGWSPLLAIGLAAVAAIGGAAWAFRGFRRAT